MGNLCSIFHSRFKNLIKVIPSARKAQLMDYILLGWQKSSYKLKGSDKKWFMKPYSQIVADTGIPQSTLERYIKELNESGFIERRQALYSRTNENGVFEIKKGSYIHITEKLLSLLKPLEKDIPNQNKDINNDSNTYRNDNHTEIDNKESNCSYSEKNEGIDSLKMRGLYIRDLYSYFSNNIKFKQLTDSVDKPTLERLIKQFDLIQQLFISEIKEEIPEEVKKLVLGTFFNLTFEHKKQLSVPNQVAAEYLFALLNKEFYLPNVSDFKHRNDILSKIIRKNNWRTPKGFYKHFYLGQNFKDKHELREKQWQQEKNNEFNQPYDINYINKNEKLAEVEEQLVEKSTLLDELMQSIYQQSSEEIIFKIREKIKTLRRELENLWHQQVIIEKEIELQHNLNTIKLCS